MKPAELIQSRYCLTITVKQMFKLMEFDKKNYTNTLFNQLTTETNAVDIDYDALWGTYIFYSLHTEDNTTAEHEKIFSIVYRIIR